MTNAFAFFGGLFGTGALIYLAVQSTRWIANERRILRRLAESQPSEAKTAVITMKAMAKPAVNSPILTISEPPSAMLGNRYR